MLGFVVARGSYRGREDIVSACVFVLRPWLFIAGFLGVCESTPLLSVGSFGLYCVTVGVHFVWLS